MKQPLPTILTVYDTETDMTHESSYLLRDARDREAEIFQLRTKIEVAIQRGKPKLVCLYCKQAVALRGKNVKTQVYFTHLKDSADCVIKTLHTLSEDEVKRIKYNGSKESPIHIELKNFIGDQLELEPDVTSVQVDKIYRDQPTDRQWKKPDVLAYYKNLPIAFELQLTTTFLSVIVSRTIFYQEHNVHLIWVFSQFSIESELQKFTEKDVFYNNNFNVYVLDEAAQAASVEAGRLKLTCYFQEFFITDERLDSVWRKRMIGLDELTFRSHPTTVCYHDSEKQRERILEMITRAQTLHVEKKRETELARIKEQEQIRTSSLTEETKKYLQACYRDNTNFPRGYISSPFHHFQTRESIQELNRVLGFKTNTRLVKELFLEGKSPNFLKMISEEPKIDLGVGQFREDGKTLLELIMNTPEVRYADLLSYLFANGYKVTESDKEFVSARVQSNFSKEESHRIGILLAYSKLTKPNLALDLIVIKQPIFHLLSAELNKVVGLKFANLKEVTNNLFEHYPNYANTYVEVLKKNNHFYSLLNDDQAGSMTPKLTQESPLTKTDPIHVSIIKDLFPYVSLKDPKSNRLPF
jgi:hypothetical protein